MRKTFYVFVMLLNSCLSVNAQFQLSGNFTTYAMSYHGGSVYAGTVGGLQVSNDGGLSWTFYNSGVFTSTVRDIVFTDSFLFVTADGIFRSADTGISWIPVATGIPNSGQIYSLEHSGSAILIGTSGSFGTDTASIYQSTDNGQSWKRVLKLTKFDAVLQFVKQQNEVWAANLPSGIYYSNDNGTNWTLQNGVYPAKNIGVMGSRLFMGTCSNSAIWVSLDKGKNWAISKNNVCGYSFATSGKTAFAGAASGFYYSLDSGDSWIQDNAGLPPTTTILSIMATDTSVFVGTTVGVYKRNLNEIIPTSIHSSLATSAIVIFPNPSKGLTTITGTRKDGVVRIFDILGAKRVQQTSLDDQTQINISDLNDGIYLLEYTENNKVYKKHIIKSE